MNKQDVLQQCRTENNVVYLPEIQLDRDLYLEVAKALQLIGGKWKGGKVKGFVFPHDPTELLKDIAGGETRNLKKETQFFETPDGLADRLVDLAFPNWRRPNWIDTQKGIHTILEPSAGHGAIIRAIHRKQGIVPVHAYEISDINRKVLLTVPDIVLLPEKDFLADVPKVKYDTIIANPPFSKNQDIDHIRHMYECLNYGGRMVSVASVSWTFGSQKKQVEFREWLESVGANETINDVPQGTFKDSGTNVAAKIIIIDKP